ncbi:MAG: type II toxin-antitoxin system VapC family toxin [Terriglobales bacterium]
MIAIDSNILVYAHREDSAWHGPAYSCVLKLAEGRDPWAIPWPCIHEFLAIVTHHRIYTPPTPLAAALDQVQAWLESPSLVLIRETEAYWPRLDGLLRSARASGPQVHDARVAALCLEHGITELWTADRDFSRFPALNVRNPLVT